jgi:hypothetical protein
MACSKSLSRGANSLSRLSTLLANVRHASIVVGGFDGSSLLEYIHVLKKSIIGLPFLHGDELPNVTFVLGCIAQTLDHIKCLSEGI